PSTIAKAGRLQDGYFAGGTAKSLIGELADRPDAVLVSAETVHDFQLQPGDALMLRLRDDRTQQFVKVEFHYVGVAREFPTAPSDSFIVANADYVARATGSNAIGTLLVDTAGRSPAAVGADVQRVLGTGAVVTDLDTTRRVVGSSLTAVDLAGLT